VNRAGDRVLQVNELGLRAAQGIHKMDKPINAKQRGNDRKERTKSPKKGIPIADRAAAHCLPSKRKSGRHKGDDGRQHGCVEVERASEVST
jgi:hypothetical protein